MKCKWGTENEKGKRGGRRKIDKGAFACFFYYFVFIFLGVVVFGCVFFSVTRKISVEMSNQRFSESEFEESES